MVAQMESPKYEAAMEIRKLPYSVVEELAKVLDDADLWKRLMSIIPRKLSSTSFRSDITHINTPKYNSEHFKIIEKGSEQYRRSCTHILFDEWGSSGRPRPSIGHLKYLLIKAQLFRAADYVAKLLGENPPPRPKVGPAAPVAISLPDIKQSNENEEAEVVHHLDEINYPQVAIERIRKSSLEVKNVIPVPVIPEIVVSEVKPTLDLLPIPLVVPKPKSEPSQSDMIKFSDSISSGDSYDSSDVVIPECSIFQGPEPKSETDKFSAEFIPVFSQLLPDSKQKSDSHSQINNTEYSEYTIDSTQSSIQSDLIPDLSILKQNTPTTESDLIPEFVAAMGISSNDNDSFDIPLTIPQPDSSGSTGPNSNSTKCPSPLPNLSLKTQLPHFSYSELEMATKNFSSDKETGTFLGAGAFGSVFLATGLLGRPVAVKKMFLENVTEVNEDDLVTKQFKNEVEVLYKCNHENLVSLLGYSCDGCTYCLIYDYVSGGSLFDALQRQSEKLSWKQRIHIALGTARGVAYLHNLSTPLIHRDIKSANILLDADNNAKLCDFGIVKLLPGQATDLDTAPCGTSAYMSPEYHRGEISVKLDTFSFGVVLLELLTSLPPLDYNREGADLVTYSEEHCEEGIDPILDKTIGTWVENNINFANEVYNITLKCLDDKKKRPFMSEVVNFLEELENKSSAVYESA